MNVTCSLKHLIQPDGNAASGLMTPPVDFLSKKDTYCPFTSYLNTNPEDTYLMASNHSTNNFSTVVQRDENGCIQPVLQHHDSLINLFRLNADGSIGEMVDFAKHTSPGDLLFSLLGKPVIPHPTVSCAPLPASSTPAVTRVTDICICTPLKTKN